MHAVLRRGAGYVRGANDEGHGNVKLGLLGLSGDQNEAVLYPIRGQGVKIVPGLF